MINFSTLIKRLDNILFTEKIPKLIEDVDNQIVINDTSFLTDTLNYSNLRYKLFHTVKYSNKYLLKQKEITENVGRGICLLTSIFNAFPELFDYNSDNVVKMKDLLEDKYDNISTVISKFDNLVLDSIISKDRVMNIIDNNLSIENKPCICIFNTLSNNGAHAVAVFGIDDKYMYYFENGNDTLLNNVINVSFSTEYNIFLNPFLSKNYFSSRSKKRLYDIFIKFKSMGKLTDDIRNELIDYYKKELTTNKSSKLTGIKRSVFYNVANVLNSIRNNNNVNSIEYVN